MTSTAVIAVSILLVLFLGLAAGSAHHYFTKERPKEGDTPR
ncbi:hypothetical protein VRY85_00365 [Achromobacter sp. F4_2707]